MRDWPRELAAQCALARLPPPVLEHRFHATRKWRFDLAWPAHLIAVEVDGGVFVAGRHTRGAGYRSDCEKVNEAALAGWRVLRILPEWVRNGRALSYLERVLRRSSALAPTGQEGLPGS